MVAGMVRTMAQNKVADMITITSVINGKHPNVTLKAFLVADRQWCRADRISHATAQVGKARSQGDVNFWTAVLKANGAYHART